MSGADAGEQRGLIDSIPRGREGWRLRATDLANRQSKAGFFGAHAAVFRRVVPDARSPTFAAEPVAWTGRVRRGVYSGQGPLEKAGVVAVRKPPRFV